MTTKAGMALLVLLTATVLASAGETGQPGGGAVGEIADTYVALTAQETAFGDEETLAVAAGGLGTCAATEVSYLQFDLSSLDQAATSATSLVVEATYASSANSGNVVLYATADVEGDGATPWQEATLTWPNRPALDSAAVLATAAAPVTAGRIRFRSAALAATVNQESAFRGDGDVVAGDDVLSLALQIEECTGLNSVVRLAAREHTQAAAPQLAITAIIWLPLIP